jgi:hypothetical protein
MANILCRMTGGAENEKRIFLCDSDHHVRVAAIPWSLSYIGVSSTWKPRPLSALRALEVLAYAFHDYEARECVSFRGLFVARKPVGRPSVLGRARTAAERMAAMRARRAAA